MSKKRPAAGNHADPAEPAVRKAGSASAPGGSQRVESFVVEVVLDAEGSIRRTSVLHVADNDQESWPAWEPQGVVEFVGRRVGSRSVLREQVDRALPPDGPLLDSIEAAVVGTIEGPPMLVEGAAFEIQATLDPGSAGPREPIEYEAVVHAKTLGAPARQKVGEVHGQLAGGERARLRVPAMAPAPGLYRLEMDVMLGEANARRTATISGGLLQIT